MVESNKMLTLLEQTLIQIQGKELMNKKISWAE